MRILIPNVITPEEAKLLKDKGENFGGQIVIDKIKKIIEANIPEYISWDKPSMARIERHPIGHRWHKDKGNDNHMSWCAYGASILLTDSKRAGYLEYKDGLKLLPQDHYCSLALHSSDVEHRVEENKDRVAFLSFLQLNND